MLNFFLKQKIHDQTGSMLVIVLVVTGLFLIMLMGTISLALLQQKLNIRKVAQTQALHIAEAGANYYRWVLYHDHDEYCNREICQASPDYGPYGPYQYTNAAGNIDGYYNLYITPPELTGSTIVKIRSEGWVDDYPNVKKSVEVQCGIPTWSTYSWLLNSYTIFGSSANVYGRLHSNTGIRFNSGAVAHNLVTSSVLDYNDPDHSGCNEFGIHAHSSISPYDALDPCPDGNNPPLNVPNNTTIFMAGRSFPVSTVSFSLLNDYVDDTYDIAEDSGIVLPKTTGSRRGYHITLKTDDTIDIKIVTSEGGNCDGNPNQQITGETNYLIGTSTPASGIIFAKDKVWVDGQINSNRITILAFGTPFTGNTTDIIINNDLLYTNYDGTDAIGLVAQRNVSIGLYCEDDLRIDAAVIAKGGRIGRDDFDCSAVENDRTQLTMFGSLASAGQAYFYHGTNGFATRNYIYDNNLTYGPPPYYPTTGEYTFISWDEE